MPAHPIRAFQNRRTRPRAVIWTGVILTVGLLCVALMIGTTTSYWFCSQICHSVQDDTISAYLRSSHSEVSCVACHMPVGANPVTFLLHKVQALGELPPTLSATFEVPLNPESELALNTEDFPSAVCLQCHALENRVVSPTRGIRIPYHGHEAVGMSCTMCHNRAAHSELGDWLPALVDPQTAAPSRKHANFMSMSGCFRCHDLAPAALAKGDCTLCHSDDFDLRPQDHKIDSWMDVHDILAQREADRVLATVEHYAKEGENAVASWQRKVRDIQDLMKLADGADNRYLHTPQNRPLVQQDGVWRCGMCHQQQDFCQPCHLQNGISRQRETARELR